ncbi:uncharacterized protein Triagg1_9570 [Trichoderma aggressivum f. europaeum]|uniref:AP-1 complex subunit sigma-1 n=1 Tax=Trichoderma aggressivum f. europaeum TaxID=173218 RepID=A0AAE1IYK6_9HYPO|nr:hypothetical protein Triagg1_9570 [Trichoderma aggressivum f. europaeum]
MESTEIDLRGHAGLSLTSQSGPGPKIAGLSSAIIVLPSAEAENGARSKVPEYVQHVLPSKARAYCLVTDLANLHVPGPNKRRQPQVYLIQTTSRLCHLVAGDRLAKWFTTLSPKDKAKIVKDVSQLVLARRTRMCNFLEYKDTKIVYRRYASLFFIAGCSSEDNELITLEIIHRYVEQMDKYYGNVCELDIIFSFTKAYYILDELLLAGELQESSKKNVLRCIGQQDSLEDMEQAEQITEKLREVGIL